MAESQTIRDSSEFCGPFGPCKFVSITKWLIISEVTLFFFFDLAHYMMEYNATPPYNVPLWVLMLLALLIVEYIGIEKKRIDFILFGCIARVAIIFLSHIILFPLITRSGHYGLVQKLSPTFLSSETNACLIQFIAFSRYFASI